MEPSDVPGPGDTYNPAFELRGDGRVILLPGNQDKLVGAIRDSSRSISPRDLARPC
jgi:hypothetical protein